MPESCPSLQLDAVRYDELAFGGPGGVWFDDHVVDGDRIDAIWLASALLLDSIQIAYRNGHRTSRHGGTGGQGRWIHFEPNEVITGINGRYGAFVEQILIQTTHRVICSGNPDSSGVHFTLLAPEGRHVNAFFGRCGRFVDAVGFRTAEIETCPPRHMPSGLGRSFSDMASMFVGDA